MTEDSTLLAGPSVTYLLLMESVHLCAVAVVSFDPPLYVLKCEDCELRRESADADELEREGRDHRLDTSHLRSVSP